MEEIFVEMTGLATVTVAVFGVIFCFMQTRFTRVSKSFAALLGVIAVNNVPEAFSQLIATLPRGYALAADIITWPSSFFLAPLLWIYVFVLTSQDQQWPVKLRRHLVLPSVAVVIGMLVLASPISVQEELFTGNLETLSPWVVTLAVFLGLFQLAIYLQIAFYLYLIIRRLIGFRSKLRDVYASTEQHELRWIYVIGGLAIGFWLVQALLLIVAVDPSKTDAVPAFMISASLVGFCLVAAMTLWGLRQRPPLDPDGADDPSPSSPSPDIASPDTIGPDISQPAGKYEKSALSPEASERLTRKLRMAMEVDHLHRDPNLSLWALAKHTGASSNYISQTLNEIIGENFFDFVNGYRIAEAKTLLSTTNESVLNITYDVGFNARSSFYNAFKRATGQTPTHYRKNMSQRDGLDDMTTPLGDT